METKEQAHWCSLPRAAETLGITPGALRKLLERAAVRVPTVEPKRSSMGFEEGSSGAFGGYPLATAWASDPRCGCRGSARSDQEGPEHDSKS